MPIERVLLWGFMASGKTVVAARLAERLGWEHIDLDEEIVRRAGRSISDIFQEEGEAGFRRLEVEATRDLIHRHELVLSPGGGWVTNPGIEDTVPPRTLTVWLQVQPATVLERLRADRDGPVRPLLAAPEPLERIRALLNAREALYGRAAHAISTDGRRVESIVDEIASLLSSNPSQSESSSTRFDV